MLKIIYAKLTNCGEKMVKIIKFPNSKPHPIVLEAEKLEAKGSVGRNLNLTMLSNFWDKLRLTNDEISMLSDFGEVMKFDPLAAARLVSKLAEKYSTLLQFS